MVGLSRVCCKAYWIATAVALAGALTLIMYTPLEPTLGWGPSQKVFYIHLPAAINAFLACLTVCLASVGYLVQRRSIWDDVAAAAARTAVLLCTLVLVSGMYWAHSAWGKWWTWSPRLTFSLLLWLLYVVYLIVRSSIESRQQRAVVSAVYGLLAFLDVPLVYLSVRMMPDIHPISPPLAPMTKLALAVWFVPMTMLTLGLIAFFYRNTRRKAILRQLDQTAPEAEAA